MLQRFGFESDSSYVKLKQALLEDFRMVHSLMGKVENQP